MHGRSKIYVYVSLKSFLNPGLDREESWSKDDLRNCGHSFNQQRYVTALFIISVNIKIGFDLTQGENGAPSLKIRDFEKGTYYLPTNKVFLGF